GTGHELDLEWSLLEVEYLFRRGQLAETSKLLTELEKKRPSYPEIHYWKLKAQVESKLKGDRSGQKYLSLCKSLSSREQRDHFRDPWLCRRTAEVENLLKKNNTQ